MAECRYWGMCRICYGSACDGVSATCDRYEPMPDVDALEALADEMEGWALTCDHYDRGVAPIEVARYAARIREACGACQRPATDRARGGRPPGRGTAAQGHRDGRVG